MTVAAHHPLTRAVPRLPAGRESMRAGPDATVGRSLSALTAAARRLLDQMRARPDGSVSPSVYETGRVVSLAPWLPGHSERLAWLVRQQHADGRWGGPGGYGLVPTLSAVEALLRTAQRWPARSRPATAAGRRTYTDGDSGELAAVTHAANRGLSALRRWLRAGVGDLPDMPAIDLIAPALLDAVNSQLADGAAPAFTGRLLPTARLDPGGRLAMLRAAVQAGHAVPEKVVHALEVLGEAARRAPGVTPSGGGLVGASPAATAAWLGSRAPRSGPARTALTALVARTGGPVPCGVPITAFERSWVLSELGRCGLLAAARPRDIVTSLASALGPDGVPAGAGLPADADTTSATLYALARAGRARPVDPLWRFETATHFCTWPGEDGASPTANAHVLEALALAPASERVRMAVARTRSWLIAQQSVEGFWTDRWHASPYYATWCCVLALDAAGSQGAHIRGALRRAARCVVDSQREDGGWGLWVTTAEETAYALMVLIAAGSPTRAARTAIAHGYSVLSARLAGTRPPDGLSTGDPDLGDDPAMWHDKDLYRPDAIVRGAVLAALRLAGDQLRGGGSWTNTLAGTT